MRPPGRNRTSQRRVFARFLRPDRPNGRPSDTRTGHNVRPWHAFVQLRAKADRTRETGKTDAGTGRGNDGPFLQLRRLQYNSRLPFAPKINDPLAGLRMP